MEIFNTLFVIFLTIGAAWFAWETSVQVDLEKRYKREQRNKICLSRYKK